MPAPTTKMAMPSIISQNVMLCHLPTRKESHMKLDLTEKGALTSIIGILLFAFVGIMHEDLRLAERAQVD
jgi:hypothetical protein